MLALSYVSIREQGERAGRTNYCNSLVPTLVSKSVVLHTVVAPKSKQPLVQHKPTAPTIGGGGRKIDQQTMEASVETSARFHEKKKTRSAPDPYVVIVIAGRYY